MVVVKVFLGKALLIDRELVYGLQLKVTSTQYSAFDKKKTSFFSACLNNDLHF